MYLAPPPKLRQGATLTLRASAFGREEVGRVETFMARVRSSSDCAHPELNAQVMP
jgi:hypothetical protein